MKEQSFWLDLQTKIQKSWVLFPFFLVFSWIFFACTCVRKWLLQTFFLYSSRIPVISVGSVTVGGAGKTPVILFLMKRLQKHALGYVSRGYGRKSADSIGDEAQLLLSEIPSLTVAVGNSKKENVTKLSSMQLEYIFLDDGLQRYDVKPTWSIGVIPDLLLFEKEYLLPLGLLREPVSRLKQVDLLCVIRETEERSIAEIEEKASTLAPSVVFEHVISDWTDEKGLSIAPPKRDVVLFCGISRPHRVMHLLEKEGYRVVEALCHGDHASLLSEESLLWARKWHEKGVPVVSTSKDWARHAPWPAEYHFCIFLHTELVPVAGENNLGVVGIV